MEKMDSHLKIQEILENLLNDSPPIPISRYNHQKNQNILNNSKGEKNEFTNIYIFLTFIFYNFNNFFSGGKGNIKIKKHNLSSEKINISKF